MQILSGASGLTGSCASCLFQAATIKTRPFPSDYHHYGDTAWLFKFLPEITLAYLPKPLARFEIHNTEVRRLIDKSQIYRLIKSLGKHVPKNEMLIILNLIEASTKIDAVRHPHPKYGWWFYPAAWIQGIKRNRSRSLLREKLFAPAA